MTSAADPPLPDAEFRQLVADLDSNTFATRQAATQKLLDYVNPASNTRLTTAQLDTLRNLANSRNLEVASRAAQVLQNWVRLNPKTVAPLRGLLSGIQVQDVDFDRVLVEGHFMIGSIRVGYDGGGVPFRNAVLSQYNNILNQLNGGFTNNVVAQLQQLRKIVADLTPQDLRSLFFSQNGNQIQKDDVLKALDMAIQSATNLINTINNSIGDPQPPAPRVPVNGRGMIDLGKTFQLVVNSNNVTPGTLDFNVVPSNLSIAAPPGGDGFLGPVFLLSAQDSLAIDGGSISVSIEYDPALQGLPASFADKLELVHFANGAYVPFSSEFNDLGTFTFQGSYSPPGIGSSGMDQFGEFALVYPVPEPSSFTLILGALFLLEHGGAARDRFRRPKARQLRGDTAGHLATLS